VLAPAGLACEVLLARAPSGVRLGRFLGRGLGPAKLGREGGHRLA